MAFKKGQSGNPAGRPVGSKNKTQEQWREIISAFLEENWATLQDDFDQMKPAERAQFRERLLRYKVSEAVSLERLSENQLLQVLEYTKKQIEDEKQG